jgi:hypothetical protein
MQWKRHCGTNNTNNNTEENIMDIQAMEKKITEAMKENHIRGEIIDYNEQTKMIAVEVIWGDWKHEHGRLDWLVEQNFSNLRSIIKQTTEEDGSDCYSAVHYYYFN